jgi:ectoine hydroxylase-related dioxygenase (phytanoyl-CoA dioxygenase family)
VSHESDHRAAVALLDGPRQNGRRPTTSNSHGGADLIPTTKRGVDGWLATVLEGVHDLGFAIVEDVLDAELIEDVRTALYRAQAGVGGAVGPDRLEQAGEVGVVRLPMLFEPIFYRLLELPDVLTVLDATVSDTAILHLQNGLVLPPATSVDSHELFQLSFHRDFRRVLNGYLCSINMFFAIDPFTSRNGATLVVPGSHQAESADHASLRDAAIPVECPAGSMIVFDSTLWHAAGMNRSQHDRLAVNQQFTRSYFKQQIDYVRALGDATVLEQRPRTQQILGWYTRVVTSLDEYYRGPDERLYRAGQG